MREKVSTENRVREIRRKTRKKYSSEEKVRIVLEGLRGEESIAGGGKRHFGNVGGRVLRSCGRQNPSWAYQSRTKYLASAYHRQNSLGVRARSTYCYSPLDSSFPRRINLLGAPR